MIPTIIADLRATVEQECTQIPNILFRDFTIPLLYVVGGACTRPNDSPKTGAEKNKRKITSVDTLQFLKMKCIY